MAHAFFTIGHSTYPLEEFAGFLVPAKIEIVADVRTVPRSRTNPQYNRDVLPQRLAELRIGYEHIAPLGGLRGRQRDVPATVNAFWENQSFHNYADYAMGREFRVGLDRLREIGRTQTTAIMCAEAMWWRCHRRIISDYLIAAGETVFHIIGPKIAPASITPQAKLLREGILSYPAEV
jgi:uncharacterized protein (DUF488 family)